MNIENMNKLIDLLKSDEVKGHFNMEFDYLTDLHNPACGTACCIGGWITYKFYNRDNIMCHRSIAKFLDISDDDAYNLAYPVVYNEGLSGYDATREQAIKLLEMLRDGEIGFSDCWDKVMKRYKMYVAIAQFKYGQTRQMKVMASDPDEVERKVYEMYPKYLSIEVYEIVKKFGKAK